MALEAEAGSVLGIDVGSSPSRRSSAVCRLDWSATELTWAIDRFRATEPERSGTIRRVAGRTQLLAAAFDGPLRTGLDVIGRYRVAERMLTRRLGPLIGKPGQSSTPVGKALNGAANACVTVVLEHCEVSASGHDHPIHHKAVVEAFPSAFLGLMIKDPAALNARRGDRSDTFYKHLCETGGLVGLLVHLLPGRRVTDLDLITNHDDRAALVCAATALCVAAGEFVAVGDHNGWIILPPADLIQPWAMSLLVANAADVGGTAMFLSGHRTNDPVHE